MGNELKQLDLLKKEYPKAKYYLNFSNSLELLIAGILSAQCTDEAVNRTTEQVFKKYITAKDYIFLKDDDVKGITFFKNKAANIRRTAKILTDKFNGKVPDSMEELISLPGIARKTANVILQNAYDKVYGVVVDTHVIRVSFRLEWTRNIKPEKIEQDLMKLFDKKEWKMLPHLLKNHGRAICKAPIPYCSKCFLFRLCPRNGVKKYI